ncbi:MAG: hypothetical protein EAZ24_00540 [Burkholderiales bacterium]|nr:MAG: hypothetical protein EAZ21_05090 [Betaproteobacteria bacterium]TAG84724.1 MAG: hypothetical protein EAZ24_00540 [Burkholderiales bacterium]
MNIDQIKSHLGRTFRFHEWNEKTFFRFSVVVVFVGMLVAWWVLRGANSSIQHGFRFFNENLPLMLPFVSVVLVVLLKPGDLRTLKGWQELSNHFALGLVSFAIWAFTTAQTTREPYITINPSSFIDKNHAVLLVLGSFIWAAFTHIVSAAGDVEKDAKSKRRWQLVSILLVPISVVAMLAPYHLFETKEQLEKRIGASVDERTWRVSIPYRDASLNQHLGLTATPLTMVYSSEVIARTKKEAKEKAAKAFREGTLYTQKFSRISERANVEILDSFVLAEPQDP